MSMEDLRSEIRGCRKCRLHESRSQAVPNQGGVDADVLFVGKRVGYPDDEVGLPYQGEAGSTLDYVLKEVGLERGDVFLTNLTRCFPPQGRDPKRDELDRCSRYFERELELVDPELIVALGRVVAERLLGMDVRLEDVHGEIHTYNTLTYRGDVLVTYNVGAVRYDEGKRNAIVSDVRGALEKTG